MRGEQRTRGEGHSLGTDSSAGHTRGSDLHDTGGAGRQGPCSAGPSDFVDFVLQVAEEGIQAFGGAPELLEHDALFLVHVLKHGLQEAPHEAF